jgi:hypothetical protein
MRLSCTPGTDERHRLNAGRETSYCTCESVSTNFIAIQSYTEKSLTSARNIAGINPILPPPPICSSCQPGMPNWLVTILGAEDALRTLWYVYLTHEDLRVAFPVSSPSYAENLLKWAAGDAKTGSMYEKETLSRYAGVYEQLGPLVGVQ